MMAARLTNSQVPLAGIPSTDAHPFLVELGTAAPSLDPGTLTVAESIVREPSDPRLTLLPSTVVPSSPACTVSPSIATADKVATGVIVRPFASNGFGTSVVTPSPSLLLGFGVLSCIEAVRDGESVWVTLSASVVNGLYSYSIDAESAL